MDKTTGCIEIHFLFAVISNLAGLELSKDRKKGSIFPKNALLGRCTFIPLREIVILYKPFYFTGNPGQVLTSQVIPVDI